MTEAVLTPASGAGFAVLAHRWDHQPWWFAIPAGVIFGAVTGAIRWWQYRR